jgi:hypothetical protein
MLGDIPQLPQYTFMAWCSVTKKHRGNFTNIFASTMNKQPRPLMVAECRRRR